VARLVKPVNTGVKPSFLRCSPYVGWHDGGGVKSQALSGEMFTNSGIGTALTGKKWKEVNARDGRPIGWLPLGRDPVNQLRNA
jgi:hypothetical protein